MTTETKKKKTTTNEQLGCVMYVDGGCRPGYTHEPDAKYGGWGIHGYTYPLNTPPTQKRTKKDVPTNAGYQLGDTTKHEDQVVPNAYIDAYGSMSNKDSSDKAELTGFKQAIALVKKGDYKEAHLLLDNRYVIDGVTQLYPKWVSMDWRKTDGSNYANRALWEDIMSVYQPLSNDVNIKITWVNGHSGNLGNDRADYLATKGLYLGRNGVLDKTNITFSPIVKYRDPKPEINRLFAKSRWYFNTRVVEPMLSKDGRYVYHCGSHGSDDSLIGKRMADAVSTVIFTKEKQHVLEAVRQRHIELVPNPLNDLCMARLDTLLLPRIYDEIEKDGINVLSLAPRKLRIQGLCTIDEQEVTRIIQPSGLTFKLIEVHNFMEAELEKFLEGKGTITEVTEYIYETKLPDDKKKKAEPVTDVLITPSDKAIKLLVNVDDNKENKHMVTLTVGIDAPPRELMRAIAPRQPKVYILVWKLSEYAFKHAMVFDLQDDIMMWMGKDSSMTLMFPEDMKKVTK